MRLRISKEKRDEYAKKLSSLYKDYNYAGGKESIPAKLLNSSDYKRLMKDLFKELISENVEENDDTENTVLTNFSTSPEEGEKNFDQFVQLAKDFLIGIDVKRTNKTKLYKDVTQIPTEDSNEYLKALKNVMIQNDRIKPKMSDKKWIKKWASKLDKWDKKELNNRTKATTQKKGIAGFFEKKRNKKAVRRDNPSPMNAMGLNSVLNELTDGNNLAQLTPQVYKVFNVVKTTTKTTTPKVNQKDEQLDSKQD